MKKFIYKEKQAKKWRTQILGEHKQKILFLKGEDAEIPLPIFCLWISTQ